MDVYTSYSDLITQLFDVRREGGISDDGHVHVPSTLLHPDRDRFSMELVPRVRRYSTLTEAKMNLDHSVAQFVLHLELVQLYQLARDSSLIEKMQVLEQNQWPAGQGTIAGAISHMENAMSEAQRHCDSIVEGLEQMMLPTVGAFREALGLYLCNMTVRHRLTSV